MNKQKHRHLVAAPIAILAVLAVTGLSNLLPVQAETNSVRMTVRLTAPSADQTFDVGGGVAGILRSGSELLADDFGSHLSLTSGQALLRASEFVSVDLGHAVTVSAIRGAFVIVRDGDSFTIAALDATLLLRSGTDLTILLPGRQVRMTVGQPDENTVVGSDWYSAQFDDLSALPDSAAPQIAHAGLAADIDRHDLRTCSSIAEEGHLSRSDLRAALADLIDAGRINADAYACILSLSDTLVPSGELRILSLLTLATEGARTDSEVSDAIAYDFKADPFLRAALPETLPVLALTKMKPAQPALINSFVNIIIEAGLRDPARAVSVLKRISPVPKALASAGLPLQSDAWKSAIGRAIVVLKTTVPESNRSDLDAAFTAVTDMPQPVTSSTPPTKPAPSTHWTADELSAITRDVLVTHGALLATTTVFTPDTESQTVRVEDIFVLEGAENVPYVFTYDPAAGAVTKIVRDGHRLPNAVPVATFFGQ